MPLAARSASSASALWPLMLTTLACFGFSVQNLLVKSLTRAADEESLVADLEGGAAAVALEPHFGTFEIIIYRGALQMLGCAAVMSCCRDVRRGPRRWFGDSAREAKWLFARGFIGYGGICFGFLSVPRMSLGDSQVRASRSGPGVCTADGGCTRRGSFGGGARAPTFTGPQTMLRRVPAVLLSRTPLPTPDGSVDTTLAPPPPPPLSDGATRHLLGRGRSKGASEHVADLRRDLRRALPRREVAARGRDWRARRARRRRAHLPAELPLRRRRWRRRRPRAGRRRRPPRRRVFPRERAERRRRVRARPCARHARQGPPPTLRSHRPAAADAPARPADLSFARSRLLDAWGLRTPDGARRDLSRGSIVRRERRSSRLSLSSARARGWSGRRCHGHHTHSARRRRRRRPARRSLGPSS